MWLSWRQPPELLRALYLMCCASRHVRRALLCRDGQRLTSLAPCCICPAVFNKKCASLFHPEPAGLQPAGGRRHGLPQQLRHAAGLQRHAGAVRQAGSRAPAVVHGRVPGGVHLASAHLVCPATHAACRHWAQRSAPQLPPTCCRTRTSIGIAHGIMFSTFVQPQGHHH